MTVHVISVGLSMLDALRDPRRTFVSKPDLVDAVRREKPDELLEHAAVQYDEARASAWLAAALPLPGDPAQDVQAADRLATITRAIRPDQWPSDISAEVETFTRIPGARLPLSADDIAVLVSSDTPLGLVAGVWNAAVLTDGALGRVRYLGSPEIPPGAARGCAVIVRVPGLDAGDERGFRQAMGGLGVLGHNLRSSGMVPKGEAFSFYLSGGFKAAIPYLIGLAEGLTSLPETGPVKAYVLHETARSSPPILLPLRRMAPERVREELKDLTEVPSKAAPTTNFLDGYAYEETRDGWRLTAFGVGLQALFGIRSPGVGP